MPTASPLRVIVSCDGAARGNPGPAGLGVEIRDPDGEVLATIAMGIGIATNNVAEYRAAIEGLRRAEELGAHEVVLRSDSKLLIEQLAGRWRVKHPTLQRLHGEARSILGRFDRRSLVHVPREMNKAADRLANEGVDDWLASEGAGNVPPGPPPSLFDG